MNNFCIADHKCYHIPMNTYSSLQSSTNSRANFSRAYRDNQIQSFRYRATEPTVVHSSLFSFFQADYFVFSVKKAFRGANIMTMSLLFLAGVFLAYQQKNSLLLCPYVCNNIITGRKCQHLSIHKSPPHLSSAHHMKQILCMSNLPPSFTINTL